ncbi:MAG TPA: Rid family hydrolase [Candidatus Hydrogenedentes bacterium]|nr:Rid family hydrolase [Candidatus Hydrogenedentota bacterium]
MSGIRNVARVARLTSHAELFLSSAADESVAPEDFLTALGDSARALGVEIVALDVFGALPAGGLMNHVRSEWPITWVGEAARSGKSNAITTEAARNPKPVSASAAQVWGVRGCAVRRIAIEGRVVGSVIEDDAARYCRCGGLLPRDIEASPSGQTSQVFDRMEAALAQADMDFSHVVRTWFFNRDITSWYREFNDARDEFFYARGVFDGIVPASTGMGGENTAGAALIGGCLAIMPKTDAVAVRRVSSPLQCPAFDYGSSFSRAVEIAAPDCRRLLVSGTASIAPEGHTLYPGDASAQMDQTLRVVEAILESRGMGWEHATRAVMYYKHAEYLAEFARQAAALPDLPVVYVHNDVCRDDLLFEMELDAIEANMGDA